MALQFFKKNNIFELSGNLNSQTSRSFIIHFEYLLNNFKIITVSIDKLTEIDASGVEAFKTLIAISLKSNSMFYITGNGSSDIYNHRSNAFAA